MPRPWLPEESIRRIRARSLGLGLALAMLTLLALNQGAVAVLERAGHNLAFRLMREKWSLLRAGAEPAAAGTWLILGDSAGNQGADPAILAGALAGDAGSPPVVLNLCVVADTLVVHDAWMLGEWVRLHGAPAGVVVVHTYDIWARESDHPNSPNTAIMLSRVPIPLSRWPLDPPVRFTGSNRGAFYATRYAPLYAENQTLAELIAHPGRTIRRLRDGADIAWQWPNPQGFMSLPAPRPQAVERDTRGHINSLRTARFHLSSDNLAGLERLAQLGQQHGFDLYLAAAPMHRGLWENPRLQAYHQDLRASLAAFAAAHPRVHIALAEPVVFDADQMQNADHVAAAAAAEYTRSLADAIRALRP